jgi:hypothetical protein
MPAKTISSHALTKNSGPADTSRAKLSIIASLPCRTGRFPRARVPQIALLA